MTNINYMRILFKEEQIEQHRDMIKWVEEVLERDFLGTYFYNILLQLKHMLEHFEREGLVA